MRQRIAYTDAALVGLCAVLLSGQTARRAAVPHTIAHPAIPCSTSLSICPAEGCGGGDPSLNVKKNRLDLPVGAPQEFTFEDFVHLEVERPGPADYMPGDRTEIEQLGEDTFIALNGFLIGAHSGSPETCNCKLSGEENNDYHLNVVERKTDRLTASVVTEMTPKLRLTKSAWTLAKLQALLNATNPTYVRVSGYLLLDTEHLSGNGGPRLSVWEIHPVTRFQVCGSTQAKCDLGTGWRDL